MKPDPYTVSLPDGDSEYDPGSLALIARGGVADVFGLPPGAGGHFALKIYRDVSHVDWKKILFQASNPLDPPAEVEPAAPTCFAWPVGIVYRREAPVGVALPLLEKKSFISLDNWIEHRLLSQLDAPNDSLGRRIPILANLARRLARLHTDGHAVVDLKPSNVFVERTTAQVCLIDCDSFLVSGGGQRFAATHVSAGYIAPESVSQQIDIASLGVEQDLFAYAVIAFQVLNYGIHPFQGILKRGVHADTTDEKVAKGLYAYGVLSSQISPLPQSIHREWPRELRGLFSRAFTQPKSRPTAIEWVEYFEKQIATKTLARCTTHPLDARHIHFDGHACMACQRARSIEESKERQRGEPSVQVARPWVPSPATSLAPTIQPTSSWGVGFGLILGFIVIGLIFWGLSHLDPEPSNDVAPRAAQPPPTSTTRQSAPNSPPSPTPATAQPSPQQLPITLLGEYGAWQAWTGVEGGNLKVCFARAMPVDSAPKGITRGEVYLTVTHRSSNNSRDVVTSVAGYSFATHSEATLSVDGTNYNLGTLGQAAWAYRSDVDVTIARAMIQGSRLTIRGVTSGGTTTNDTYSLNGFAAAHDAIDKACPP